MQRLHWSKSDIERDFSSCNNFDDLIKSVENLCARKGEVLCEVHVNGMYISETDEAKFSESDVSEIESLEVTSQGVKELISASILSVIEMLPQLKGFSIDCAESLRMEMAAESFKDLAALMDGCLWLSQSLDLLKKNLVAGIDKDRL